MVSLLHFATEDDDLLEEEHSSVFCSHITGLRCEARTVFVARQRAVMQELSLSRQLSLKFHKALQNC